MIENYWLKQAQLITWEKKPNKELRVKKNNHYEYFPDGKLNLYENLIENNLLNGLGNKTAIITVDKEKNIQKYTYNEIDQKVNFFSNFLLNKIPKNRISKTRIMIHSSSSLNSAISMLSACKLGIFFSVIFEDLSGEAISKRIKLFKPDIFITSKNKDFFKKKIYSKIKNKRNIKYLIFDQIKLKNLKSLKKIKNYIIPANKDFFSLFTSGSTGEPKGIVHSAAGYFLYAKYTSKKQFNMNVNSTVLTASDAGWINGHTYALFGPLSFGATTILLESPISLLDDKLLKNILKQRVTILYLPVTLIRLMKTFFNKKFQTKFLNTLGSMGEPLAPSVAEWYSKTFSKKKKCIVNTYFQTETGGIIASPKFNEKIENIPHGSVGKLVNNKIKLSPLFKNRKLEIKIQNTWPGCMKKILNKGDTWQKYWDKNNHFRLFDLATIQNNNIFIHGRTDDVINIRGHRIGSEELESIILKINGVIECCAISQVDEIEGNSIFFFISSRKNKIDEQINDKIIKNFGSFALPKKIYYLSELPKTRSGKILRRLLRTILTNPSSTNYGDLSTMLNKDIISEIKLTLLHDGR